MKISNEVLQELSQLSCNENRVVITEQLDRKLYLKVNEVLEALGGAWNRKAKAHLFPVGESAADHIDVAMLTGEVSTARDLGFFTTPAPLAARLVEMAEVQPEHLVLEPEAGEGVIVDELLKVAGVVRGVEIDEKKFHTLLQHYLKGDQCWSIQQINRSHYLKGDQSQLIHPPIYELQDLQRHDGKKLRLLRTDFMRIPIVSIYDRVVMNPMFMRSGLGDHLDHVRHAWEMLRAGGILVSVLPVSVKWRKDSRHEEFRYWCSEEDVDFEATDLPEGSFKTSGTNVRTYVLKMRKGGE